MNIDLDHNWENRLTTVQIQGSRFRPSEHAIQVKVLLRSSTRMLSDGQLTVRTVYVYALVYLYSWIISSGLVAAGDGPG